jgi:hypothetical protein
VSFTDLNEIKKMESLFTLAERHWASGDPGTVLLIESRGKRLAWFKSERRQQKMQLYLLQN